MGRVGGGEGKNRSLLATRGPFNIHWWWIWSVGSSSPLYGRCVNLDREYILDRLAHELSDACWVGVVDVSRRLYTTGTAAV